MHLLYLVICVSWGPFLPPPVAKLRSHSYITVDVAPEAAYTHQILPSRDRQESRSDIFITDFFGPVGGVHLGPTYDLCIYVVISPRHSVDH